MRLGWLVSLCAHIAVACAWFIVWPHKMPSFEDSAVVPIEIVISDKTNLAAVAPKDVEPGDQPEEEGGASSEAAPPPEALEAVPDKKAPEKKPEKKPAQQFSTADIENLLKNLDQKKPGPQPKPQTATGRTGDKAQKSFGDAGKESASLKDSVRAQFDQKDCWRSTADMPNPERLIVRVKFSLSRDGSLSNNPQVISQIMPGDTTMQVAANNAVRAVRVCMPLRLPAESYDIWRDLTLTFDGRGQIQ
jgi:colicin import membrane protein